MRCVIWCGGCGRPSRSGDVQGDLGQRVAYGRRSSLAASGSSARSSRPRHRGAAPCGPRSCRPCTSTASTPPRGRRREASGRARPPRSCPRQPSPAARWSWWSGLPRWCNARGAGGRRHAELGQDVVDRVHQRLRPAQVEALWSDATVDLQDKRRFTRSDDVNACEPQGQGSHRGSCHVLQPGLSSNTTTRCSSRISCHGDTGLAAARSAPLGREAMIERPTHHRTTEYPGGIRISARSGRSVR
jgi:hypothetical protein